MRKCLTVAALVLTIPFTVDAQQVAQAGRSRDAASIDPAHHQVILENDHVRVVRALVSPGDRSPMHTHPPAVLVSLGTSRSRVTNADGSTGYFDLQPGQVIWGAQPAEHSWQMLAGQLHIVGVEIKAAARGAAPAAKTLPENDAAKVDPVGHQILVDNPYVRVLEGLSGTGRKSPMHSHSYGFALVSLGRGRLNLTFGDGNSTIVDVHPGQVMWLDAQAHSWEVVSGVSNLIAIEVKSAAAK
jgi:quercetin dioxygenase-like cupin family protein